MGFAAAGPTQLACAAEPSRQFLTLLVNRGYHDTALEYLDWLERTDMAPQEFHAAIGYEHGNILLSAASLQQDAKVREQDLAQAEKRFAAFLSQHAGHPRVVDAERGLRQIKVELARGLMRDTAQPGADSKKLYRQAQAYFDEAAQSYERRGEEVRQQLEDIRKGKADGANRDRLRAEYLQSKLMSATVAYEVAATTRSDSRAYQKRMQTADQQFAELAEKYRTWLAGILAVYYRGRIQQDLGNLREALAFYEEHVTEMNQPDAFRNVAAKATANALQCWIDPQLKQYDRAIEVGEQWIAAARPGDNSNPDWLALRMMIARAYRAKAEQADGTATTGLLAKARQTAQFVARFSGPTRSEARKFLAELGGRSTSDSDVGELETFSDARNAAIEARQGLGDSDTLLKLQTSKLASIASENGRQEAQAQLAETQKQNQQLTHRAAQLHRLALQLADVDTPVEQLNDLRYYYCYLLYRSRRYYEAAVLGDFLAKNYPSAPGARTAANIALASYATIQNEYAQANAGNSPPANGTPNLVADRLEGLADHIVRTWPGQKETDDALITLVNFMVRDGRFDQAEQYLAKIPEESARRGDAEMRTGQALWAQYVRTAADTQTGDESLKQRAEAMLQDGIQRMKTAPPSESLLRAVLSLAQIQIENNAPQAAIKLLENKRFGPKSLADQQSPLITKASGLAEMVYRVTLRGYIAAASTDKVTSTMEALGKTIDDSPAGRRRLVGIYMGLAKDLRTQLQQAPPEDRKALSDNFDSFLANVASNSEQFNILNWVATTYAGLGDGFTENKNTSPSDAQRFFEKAAREYQRILTLADQGTLDLDQNMVATMRMRLASMQRRLGAYDQAVTTLRDILSENNMMLNVQVEAARALQAGATAGKTKWYTRALMGDSPAGSTPVIWGWVKISKIVAAQMVKDEQAKRKFGDTFYDARLQMAQCQYEQSARAPGEQKTKYLHSAKKVLQSTAEFYPNLGGPEWTSKYNRLFAKVQTALGEPVTSLQTKRKR